MIYVALMMAGSSTRMNLDTPKQYLQINNKYLFEYPLETFAKNNRIDQIILVVDKTYMQKVNSIIQNFDYKNKLIIVEGSTTRQKSVFNALNFLMKRGATDKDYILIHDACRVLLTTKLLNEIIDNLSPEYAIVPALEMTDSICYSEDKKFIEKSLKRDNYFSLQTPQAFNLHFIFKAHENALNSSTNNFTDDTSLVIITNGKVKLIRGDKFNFKITTFEDLFALKRLIG